MVRGARPKAHLSITPSKLTYLGGRVRIALSSSHATRCTLFSKPRFWNGPNPLPVKCSGKATAVLPAVSVGLRWTFKFTASNGKRRSVATRRLVLRGPPFQLSSNWSGYVVPSSSPVTSVSGRFTVPTLDCKKTTDAGEATWVGIGGDGPSSGDLLQTGVRSDCLGGVQYDNTGWWEEYPEFAVVDFKSMSVSAGDSMQAAVSQNSDGSWTTRIDDLTKGVSGVMTTGSGYGTMSDSNPGVWLTEEGTTTSVAYAGGSTAEWIVEDYGLSDGSLVPLADFGKIAFTGLTASLPSWSLTPGEQIGLASGAYLMAAPTAPDSSGRGFSVAFTG